MARKILMTSASYRQVKEYPIGTAMGPKESYSDDYILVPIEEASFQMLQNFRKTNKETQEDLILNYMLANDKG